MKRVKKVYGIIPPMIGNDFGNDYSVSAFNDVGLQSVRVVDMWGYFIPVPFQIWDSIVNKRLYPYIINKHQGLHSRAAYEEAISIYCTQNQHLYICNN